MDLIDDPAQGPLREKVERAARDDRQREVALKDLHLVEAALATDSVVISTDDEARSAFSAIASRGVGELRNVAWLNPASEANETSQCLKGADLTLQEKRLGSRE